MKSFYPLKKAQSTNIVEPLMKYLEVNESPQTAMNFRDALNQINQLRNKATALELDSSPTNERIDKFIAVIEMYVKFAQLLAKHFNWNPDYGVTVQDLNITWFDSFNQQMLFTKN